MKRATAHCAMCARPFLREPDATWKRFCVDCWRLTRSIAGRAAGPTRTSAPAASPIDPAMLRRLLQLCHPDRHDGSATSVAATQYLLQLRNAGR